MNKMKISGEISNIKFLERKISVNFDYEDNHGGEGKCTGGGGGECDVGR